MGASPDSHSRNSPKDFTHRFAAGVDRSIIEKGSEMLDADLTELITDTIMGMREVAEQIGLKGSL